MPTHSLSTEDQSLLDSILGTAHDSVAMPSAEFQDEKDLLRLYVFALSLLTISILSTFIAWVKYGTDVSQALSPTNSFRSPLQTSSTRHSKKE